MLEQTLEYSYNLRPGINFLSKSFLKNPFPTLIEMLKYYPVCQVEPGGIWAVTRYRDVEFVLMRSDIFSAKATKQLYQSDWIKKEYRGQRPIVVEDPPEHGKYNGFINKPFLANVIKKLEPFMRETANSLLNDLKSNKQINFAEAFSYPYVGQILKNIVGVGDKQSLSELREWIDLEQRISPIRPDEEFIKSYEAALQRQYNYFSEAIEERRKCQQKDLVTHFMESQTTDGRKLGNKEICGLLCQVVAAGYMTTIQALNHAIILLSKNDDLLWELSAFPELIPDFIEELMRYTPPSLGTIRETLRDVELSGVTIPKNSKVLPITAAANRDFRVFENPNVFDIRRPRNKKHLGFGRGVHVCIGAALARLELKVALETLLSNFKKISCAPNDKMVWIDSLFMYGVSELPASFS